MPFPAKYAGKCRACGRAIGVGDPISDSGATSGLRWIHATCAESALDFGPDDPVAARADAGSAVIEVASEARAVVAPIGGPALEVWTDGACSGNPGPGGWAWATRDGRQGSGGAAHTTNQRMEIQAALEAVRALPERPLTVVSDSTYVVNCFRNGWWRGWLAKGWLTSARKPVANRDLWEPLIAAYQVGGIDFRWVKGHSGDQMNDLVDQLAVAAGQRQRPD